jgi:uncharacterized repeat protein (TIGR01451 family)
VHFLRISSILFYGFHLTDTIDCQINPCGWIYWGKLGEERQMRDLLLFRSSVSSIVRNPVSTDSAAFAVPAALGANIVDNLGDVVDGDLSAGQTTLREAIMMAAPGSTITFDPIIAGGTIALGSDLLIQNDITIDGGDNDITVSGSNTSTVFSIDTGATVVLDSLIIADGNGVGSISVLSGGAIFNQGILTIQSSTIKNSFAMNGGGGIYNFLGTLTLDNSLVTANTAGNQGGGLNNEVGTVSVSNSTISGNTSNGNGFGAGIANVGLFGYAADLNLSSSTIVENVSNGSFSPGILNGELFGGIATAKIGNTIISGNTGGDELQIANYSNFGGNVTIDGSGGYNLISDNSTLDVGGDGNQFNTDPLLEALADNGGKTETHAIQIGSPAFNMGDPGFTPPPDFDQRGDGFDRISGGRVDVGAYEFQFGSVTIIKDALPADGTDFDFTSNITGSENFILDDADPDDGDAFTDTILIEDVLPGSYTVSELSPPIFQLSDLSIESNGSTAGDVLDLVNDQAMFMVDEGEDVTLSFFNDTNVDLAVDKFPALGSDTTPLPGSEITYSIAVANNGTTDAANVSITDLLPPELLGTEWSLTDSQGTMFSGIGDVGVDGVYIAAGSTVIVTATGLLDCDLTSGISLTNTASATPIGVPEQNPIDNTDTDTSFSIAQNSPGVMGFFGRFLAGTPGNDEIIGNERDQTIIGNFGNDSLFGGGGVDLINGQIGNDLLVGGSGGDVISGGVGNDTLDGACTTLGVGQLDRLTGDAGSDLFVLGNKLGTFYLGNGNADFAYITDFNPGVDTIQLSGALGDYVFAPTNLMVTGRNIFGQGIFQGGDLIAILQQSAASDSDITFA